MSRTDRYFLNGIIRTLKPKKILEAGVASGAGSAIILNAISDIDGAELYSVDYAEESVNTPGKLSGFLVEEKFAGLTNKWHIFKGGDVSHFLDEVGGNIDLFMLDTSHTHPWETLNFICTLPFMKKSESWVVLHDIDLFVTPRHRNELACRYLFASVVSDEKVTPAPDKEEDIFFPNIGAFKVSEITEKHISNLFEALLIPWNIKISARDLDDIRKIISTYYPPEYYKFFCDTLDFQEYMFSHRTSLKGAIYGSIKQRANPKFLRFLMKIKHALGLS